MFDHVRRVVAVVLTALVLLAAPQIAHAAFSGRAAPQLAVGTATMQAPANVSSTEQCRYTVFIFRFRNGVDVNVNNFTDNGPAGATYSYKLTRPNGEVLDQETSANRSASLGTSTALAQYTVTIQATLGNWTSPVWSKTIAC